MSGGCRSPDEARIKDKMIYASSKDALRRALVGIASEIQGTDFSEVAYDEGGSCSFPSLSLFALSVGLVLIRWVPLVGAVLDKVSRGTA